MQLPSRQQGMGMWGWFFVLGTLGLYGMVGLALIPFYLSEQSISKVVRTVAQDPSTGSLAPAELRKALQTRWDVEGITTLDTRDVKIVKHGAGRALSYDYEARAPLFYNLAIVAHFQSTYPISTLGSVE